MADRFRRGEVEQMLWALKANKRHLPPMPSEFGTRIRRLLDIDREAEFEEVGASLHAFSADAPGGKGSEALFSHLDLLMLWLGLELVEMGFKQREVVHQLCYARPVLSRALSSNLNKRAADAPPLYLALTGVERSALDWVRTPRPSVMDADDIAREAARGTLGRILLLPVGWAAFRFEETLELPPPPKRGRPPSD